MGHIVGRCPQFPLRQGGDNFICRPVVKRDAVLVGVKGVMPRTFRRTGVVRLVRDPTWTW